MKYAWYIVFQQDGYTCYVPVRCFARRNKMLEKFRKVWRFARLVDRETIMELYNV